MSAPIPCRSRRTAVALVLTTLLGLTLGGCDLRLETAAPTERTPSAGEVLRAGTVEDALVLVAAARSARASATGSGPAVAPVLDDVIAFSSRHAAELGGVYSSGLHPSPTASASAAPTAPPSTPTDVVALLTSAAARALASADTDPDGAMARLLGSIGTARGQLATRLAIALGLPAPAAAPTAAPGSPAATSPAATAPTASVAASTPGTGLSPADLDALTLVQDQAGYGLEVVAAKLDGGARARALAAARAHRAAAEAWAVRAGTAATSRDPRRAAYALPSGLDDPAAATELARTLETAVADADATMVAAAAPGARGPLLTDLRTAADAAVAWGAAPAALPGMPGTAAPTVPPTPSAAPTA